MTKTTILTKITKKLLSAKAWDMRGSKVPNQNDENHKFDENYNKLLSAKPWDMKEGVSKTQTLKTRTPLVSQKLRP